MNYKTGKRAIAAILAAGMAFSCFGCSINGKNKANSDKSTMTSEKLENKDAAITVGDVQLSMNDVAVINNIMPGERFNAYKERYVMMTANVLESGALAETLGVEVKDEDLNKLIEAKAQRASYLGGYKAYTEFLEKSGSSMKAVEAYERAVIYQSKLSEKLDDEVKNTDEGEIIGYLEENYYRAKHILLRTEEKDEETVKAQAEGLLERAKNGEDFDALVGEFGEDPGMTENHDGYVFTDGDMVSEFEECVKSLQPGEFGMCKTDYGYHVIERLSIDDKDENFASWLDEKRKEAVTKLLIEKRGVKANIDWDKVNAYTEDQLPEQPSNPMMGF